MLTRKLIPDGKKGPLISVDANVMRSISIWIKVLFFSFCDWNQIIYEIYKIPSCALSTMFKMLNMTEFSKFIFWVTGYSQFLPAYFIAYKKGNSMNLIKNTMLTHCGRDKMAAIFQTTFSIAFSWMKKFEFWLRFHWSLFPRVQLTIFHHWFR